MLARDKTPIDELDDHRRDDEGEETGDHAETEGAEAPPGVESRAARYDAGGGARLAGGAAQRARHRIAPGDRILERGGQVGVDDRDGIGLPGGSGVVRH